MRSTTRLGLALLWVGALTGCGASQQMAPDAAGSGTTSSDQAEVSQAIAESPDLVEDDVFAALDETALGEASLGAVSVEAPIHPLRYWREIRSVERRFEFAFSDSDSTGRPTRALVTIHKQLRGSFNIAAGEPRLDEPTDPPPGEGPRDTSITIVHKRLADHWVRRIALQRVPLDDAGGDADRLRRQWRIVGSSAVEVSSNLPEVRPTPILSLHIRAADFSATITDPLALHRLRDVLTFDAETEVGLTVTTGRPDDVVVLMHRDRRFRLTPNGDNTYSGVWKAPLRTGFHHLGVNALARGTLFDDEAPYSSEAWILPYVVRGAEPVAALEP